MAYDNPAFMERSESTVGVESTNDSEFNLPPFSTAREDRIIARERPNGNDSINCFPLKNGLSFSRGARSESTSSDPKSFEPLPSVIEKSLHDAHVDSLKSSLQRSDSNTQHKDKETNLSVGDILNF